MLRKVITAPRHYLEHSVAILTCKLTTRNSPSVRFRWSAAAATTTQYSAIGRVPWQGEENRVEGDAISREPTPHQLLPLAERRPWAPPDLLARNFTMFLDCHGQTTESALRCLTSGSPDFSLIRQIFQHPVCLGRVVRQLASSDTPALCVRLLSLAVAYGRPPKASVYETVCWSLSLNKRYNILLEVYRLAKDSLGVPTPRLLDWRLRALFELENFAAIEKIFQEYEQAGAKPSRRTWHLILIAHLRNRNLAAARRCLTSMEEAGFLLDPTTHAAIATNYRYLGLDSQVRDLAVSNLGSLPPSSSVFVVNQLLESHLLFGDEVGFYQLLSLFDSNAIAPIRSLLIPSGDFKDPAVQWAALKPSLPLIPNATTFLIAVRFCVARSNLLAAEKIFHLMEKQVINMSHTILVAYLNVQFAIGRPDFAAFVASRLLSADNLGDLFDSLVRRQPKPHWKWPYPTSRISPHIDIFNALLKGLLPVHGLNAFHIISQLMERTRVKPNAYTVKILVAHLVRSERAAPSTVLRTLRQLSPVFRPSLGHLHPLVSRFLRDERSRLYSTRSRRRSAHRVTQVQKPRSSSSEETYHDSTSPVAGLEIDRFLSRPNLARSLIASMTSRSIRSDSSMLGLRMQYEGVIQRNMTSAVDTYMDMLSRGMTPSHYHIAALMEGFVQQGEIDAALKIMRSVKDHNMEPNLVMYTILLHGYAHQNRPKAALRLFQEMISIGIKPDVRIIYGVCNAFILAQQLGLARKVLITLWSYIGPFPRGYAGLPLLQLLAIFRNLDPSFPTSRQSLSLTRRIRLRQQLTRMVVEYKCASGLRSELISNSPKVKRLAEASLHVSRKV